MIELEQVEKRLFADEGNVPFAYRDSKGFWTIGPGILIDERRGGGLSLDESKYLLRGRILKLEEACIRRFPWWLDVDDGRQQIIVCMAYQLGMNGVANFKKMCAAMAEHDYERAADEMLDSEWARKDSPERAHRMAQMMRTGEFITI
jgi:lysozyme